jgi:fermentation-respiration switch protein FrsA (DUF1100 family)
MRKRLMTYLIFIPVVLVLMALWLRWREPNMIYYPTRQIDRTPDQLGWKFEDVYLTTSDGVRINGWFIPAPVPLPSSPFTLLFLHGNAGNISHRLEKLAIFRELGADVFILDYRGYGRSDGVPNEAGTYRDAQAAYEYLTGTLNREPRTLLIYGESLGSAVAVDLAAKKVCGGVVIEEPFTSIADVGQKMFPFLPIRLLVRNKYDTLSKIARINGPLLIFHSRDDEYFPISHAERLIAAAREPKHLVELRGGHNDAFVTSAGTYRNELKKFLTNLAMNSTTHP